VNLTPPPPQLVAPAALQAAQRRIETAADALGIQGFARVDAFMHADTGEVVVIEANTVPGMTPSTVLFHQVQCRDLRSTQVPCMTPLGGTRHAPTPMCVCLSCDVVPGSVQ
jgi:hypothetical protein